MRVVLVNHRYAPYRGGSEIFTQKLAEWLARAGWQVRVVTTDAFDLEYFWDPGACRVEAPEMECVNDVWIERVPVRHRPGKALTFGITRRAMGEASCFVASPLPFRLASRFVPSIPELGTRIQRDGPADVVIATNLGLESLALEALAAAHRMGAQFVLLPFAHLGDRHDAVARRYVSMPHHRELLRNSDLVLALTKLEAEFVESCGVEVRRTAVIGAGIDHSEVTGGDTQHIALLFGKAAFVVAAIGALAPDKGTPALVEASRLLRQRGIPIQLILAGPSLSAFERWMGERGAHDWPWVHTVGVIEDQAKRDLLAGIDVLALPSRTESFGIVFLEGWANRKPVVGAAVGALNEVITEGEDGFLVPFGDPAALADRLERLAKSESLRTSLGEAGSRKVVEHYTWERVLERVEQAFHDVLGLRVR